MKILNYSLDYLVETRTPQPPKRPYTDCQYWILCRVIKQKKIPKKFFYSLLNEVYHCNWVKDLSYEQMYRIIYILNHWKLTEENRISNEYFDTSYKDIPDLTNETTIKNLKL